MKVLKLVLAAAVTLMMSATAFANAQDTVYGTVDPNATNSLGGPTKGTSEATATTTGFSCPTCAAATADPTTRFSGAKDIPIPVSNGGTTTQTGDQ